MIKDFQDIWLQNFFEHDVHHKKIPASIRDSLFRKSQILDDATCDLDLQPPSNHFFTSSPVIMFVQINIIGLAPESIPSENQSPLAANPDTVFPFQGT